MGIAFNIVPKKQLDGLETSADCTGISPDIEALDAIATRIGVRPLSEFTFADPRQLLSESEIRKMRKEGIKVPSKEPWFPAAEGLVTVRALLAHLKKKMPKAIADGQRVLEDLEEYERCLVQFDAKRVLFHIAMLD